MGLWQKVIESGASYLVVAILGALIMRLRLKDEMANFNRETVQPLREEIAALKTASANYVTRAELEKDMKQLRDDMKEWVGLLRDDIKELAKEIKQRYSN